MCDLGILWGPKTWYLSIYPVLISCVLCVFSFLSFSQLFRLHFCNKKTENIFEDTFLVYLFLTWLLTDGLLGFLFIMDIFLNEIKIDFHHFDNPLFPFALIVSAFPLVLASSFFCLLFFIVVLSIYVIVSRKQQLRQTKSFLLSFIIPLQ